MNEYAARLFKVDPYEGLNPDDYPSDVNGWGNHPFSKFDPHAKLVVEVGAWKGRGTIALANSFPDATILSIDTWLGSLEMWINKDDPDRYNALCLKNGYPQLYFEFLANMVRAGIQDRVVPIPMTSETGLALLLEWNAQPDLIFIDAAHDYASVRRDIIYALELEPKVLCGDDHQPGWPGVVSAVDELLPTSQKEGVFWWL